jgi:hypothetical protein
MRMIDTSVVREILALARRMVPRLRSEARSSVDSAQRIGQVHQSFAEIRLREHGLNPVHGLQNRLEVRAYGLM